MTVTNYSNPVFLLNTLFEYSIPHRKFDIQNGIFLLIFTS